MPSPIVCRLPAPHKPLLDKFYKAQRMPMKAQPSAAWWVVRAPEVVAAMNLQPLAEGGHWLTGLLVASEHRGQGLARRLLEHGCAGAGPVWLFCQPGLEGFYQRLGFAQVGEALPAGLRERLQRYRRGKALLAMGGEFG
ncbi:GNAT family N-acetyltransferase [Pseudomonas sp. NPDC007930]|uniref:GNAT family N-acetyltransferase n=1 Tax=Pseudomonas sp. NPDC007930 TaxID=3364417 RepID=UPI0036E2C5B5